MSYETQHQPPEQLGDDKYPPIVEVKEFNDGSNDEIASHYSSTTTEDDEDDDENDQYRDLNRAEKGLCEELKKKAVLEYIPTVAETLDAFSEAAEINKNKVLKNSSIKGSDNSTFSRVLCLYNRDGSIIVEAEEKRGFQSTDLFSRFSDYFDALDRQLANGDDLKQMVVNTKDLYEKKDEIPSHFKNIENFWVLEHHFKNSTFVKGMVLINTFTGSNIEPKYNNFHKWFAQLIVRDTKTNLSYLPSCYDEDMAIATKVADYFGEHLKNTVEDDKWDENGRAYFIKRAHYFTRRNLKLQAVLPAFPCKSSNLEKVGGVGPDKGEELGLRRLIAFTTEMERIYAPGFKLWIVSDGHVFSDCIGVDDDVVDEYTETLKQLYKSIIAGPEFKNKECIGFVSLKDILYKSDLLCPIPKRAIKDFQINHLTGTKIDEDSDLSRQMMMAGCDTDDGQLAEDISIPNHPRLHLFRGFARFMKEDLIKNDYFKGTSKKKFSKVVSQVAFEMIKRNDAYSNLVELIFPFHLRFSIHAHNNYGPKFGIRLIKSDKCKIIKELGSSEEPECEDLLHIPTPWHNVIVKIASTDMHYLTKKKAVTDSIRDGHYTGEWIENDHKNGKGGYFLLKRN